MTDTPKARRVREARMEWLRDKIDELEADLATFREVGVATAICAMHKEVRTHRKELDEMQATLAAEDDAAQMVTAEDLTPEQWAAKVRSDAQAATDDDLEVYVYEWMERKGLRLVHEGNGARLVRAAG